MTADLMHAVAEIEAHADAYRRAAAYYYGEVGELFVSDTVRRALRGELIGFDINLARRAVDAVLDRMTIHAVSVPNDEAATRRLIDTVWSPNRLGRYSRRVHWAALTYGDAYLIVWPGAEDNTVELHYNSPLTTRVFYSAENERVKSYAAKLWVQGHDADAQVHRCDLYYPDRIERYVTAAGAKVDQPSAWRPYLVDPDDPDETWPLENPYQVVPVFHWRTGEPYGRPEHQGAYGPQNAITKLSATLMATIDYQGFPQRYALMNPTTSGADGMFQFPDADDENPAEADSGLESGPGKVWRLDAKNVGQFDPANVEAFLTPMNFYARAMAAATATPLRFLEPSGNVPSGEALRADDGPLAHRVEDREEVFGDEWAAVLGFASLVAGEAIPEVDVQWRPVQTTDDKQGWETVLLKMEAGVPFVQAMTEAGYASDLAKGWEAEAVRAEPAPVPAPTPDTTTAA